jgi:ActR/RegA family two-component response regulator
VARAGWARPQWSPGGLRHLAPTTVGADHRLEADTPYVAPELATLTGDFHTLTNPWQPTPRALEIREAILVVDANAETRARLCRFLGDDYEVHVAGSEADAVRVLRQRPIAVLIVDQRLPDTSGTELVRRMREECPAAVGLLLVNYCDLREALSAMATGFLFQYLTKPCDAEELECAVRRAVSEHHRESVPRPSPARDSLTACGGRRFHNPPLGAVQRNLREENLCDVGAEEALLRDRDLCGATVSASTSEL